MIDVRTTPAPAFNDALGSSSMTPFVTASASGDPDSVADAGTVRRLIEAWSYGRVTAMSIVADVPGVHRVLRVAIQIPAARQPPENSPTATTAVIVKCFGGSLATDRISLLARWNATLDPSSALQLAPALLVDEHNRIVVAEDLGEARVDQLVARWGPTDIRSLEILRDAGRCLGEIQRLDARGIPVLGLTDHVVQLIAPHPSQLIERLPKYGRLIETTLDYLVTASEPLRQIPSVVSHCDFHLRQLLLTGDRIGVIDWDVVAAGDPAFDVAYLITYLETHGIDPTGELSLAFLRGYRSSVGTTDADFPQRLRTYRLFNLLRRACRRVRLADEGWESKCEHMLSLLETAIHTDLGPS